MDTSIITDRFDTWTEDALGWIGDNGEGLFDFVSRLLESSYDGILWVLQLAPPVVIALIAAFLGWRLINLISGIFAGVALLFCAAMGLWTETMSTLALVATATILALLVGIPVGILAGFTKSSTGCSSPCST